MLKVYLVIDRFWKSQPRGPCADPLGLCDGGQPWALCEAPAVGPAEAREGALLVAHPAVLVAGRALETRGDHFFDSDLVEDHAHT